MVNAVIMLLSTDSQGWGWGNATVTSEGVMSFTGKLGKAFFAIWELGKAKKANWELGNGFFNNLGWEAGKSNSTGMGRWDNLPMEWERGLRC